MYSKSKPFFFLNTLGKLIIIKKQKIYCFFLIILSANNNNNCQKRKEVQAQFNHKKFVIL